MYKRLVAFLFTTLCLLNWAYGAACPVRTLDNGWCRPVDSDTYQLPYNGKNDGFPGASHLAQDIKANENDSVYFVWRGYVKIVRTNVNFFGNAPWPCDIGVTPKVCMFGMKYRKMWLGRGQSTVVSWI